MTHSKPSFPGPEQIRQHQFANGLTLLLYENFTAESVSLEGFIRAGALAEPARAGGAGLLHSRLPDARHNQPQL
jgi:predicted Zn-dependent peptidase